MDVMQLLVHANVRLFTDRLSGFRINTFKYDNSEYLRYTICLQQGNPGAREGCCCQP
jgi:hypothetical protein